MDSIRLINYRGLEDTGTIEIKPLTFLLGANSSGKSSFLKVLPLLKQSANNNVRGTFLWNGPLVDYEDFHNVVRNGNGDITMSFKINDLKYLGRRYWVHEEGESISLLVSITLSKKEDRWDYLRGLKIEVNTFHIDITFDSTSQREEIIRSILINGTDYSKKCSNVSAYSFDGIIPRLVSTKSSSDFDETEKYWDEIISLLNITTSESNHLVLNRLLRELPFYILLGKDIESLLNKRLGKDFIWDNSKYQNLCNITLYFNINNIIDSINDYISSFASNVTYVAPIRANFERYYRFQNYSVDAIDADGHNLAMFLNSLGKSNLGKFNQWLSRVFNFEIKLTPSVGHVAIELKEHDRDYRNLVDLGFGYTELLPILAMIWKDVEYDRNDIRIYHYNFCKQHTFAIEQPELHLHPRFQAKFAQLIVNVINDAKIHNYDVRFVIETHSEVIINKIGELIAKSSCNNDDVNVVLFSAKKEGLDSYVESTKYTPDGYILNWPYGFFDEEDVD